MRKNALPITILFAVALCAAILTVMLIPKAPTEAQGYVNRTVVRDSEDDSPYAFDKRFSGNGLIYEVWFNAGSLTNTGELQVSLDAQAGAIYDRTLLDIEMTEGEYTDGVAQVSFPSGLFVVTGDVLTVDYENPDAETVGLAITVEQ